MVYAEDFQFNGRALSSIDPNLVIVSFRDMIHNSDDQVVNRAVSRSEIMADDALTYDYGVKDVDVMRLTITVCDANHSYLSQETIRNLHSWLFSPTEPQWLSFTAYNDESTRIQDPVYTDVHFKGRFIRSTYDDIGAYNKIGITFEFENISPYGFTPQYSYTVSLDQPETDITLTGHGTNVGKLVTPIILLTSDSDSGGVDISEADNLEFEEGNGQIMSIHNTDGNTAPFLIQIPSNTTVAIIGDNCYYWDEGYEFDVNNMDLYSFDNLANFNWPRMVSGANNHFEFVGTGSCQIIVRYFEALGV